MAGQATVKIGDREWVTDVATQPWELSQGLGGISGLPAGTGMLFDLGWEPVSYTHLTLPTILLV